MKITVALLILLTLFSLNAFAQVNIPDAKLRTAVLDALDKPTDAQLTPADMANLTRLDAPNAGISDLTGLQHATNLEIMNLWNNQLSDISELSGLTQLTELYLSDNQLSDISALAGLTNLTTLWLSDNPLSDISALSGLTQLTNLALSSNQLSDISALSGLTQLTSLGLNGNQQLSDVSALSGLTNLTTLWLNDTKQISDISALANLTNLTLLTLGDNQISDISALANLTNLTILWLVVNQISDISALANLTNLTELYLRNNQISDISELAGLTNLRTLHLQVNPLSYASIYTHIPTLQDNGVEVGFTNRTPAGLAIESGDNQTGEASTLLAQPLVVKVTDENDAAFEGVSVTFTITSGGGTLSETSTTTDADGLAESTLTLGSSAGTNTVEVTASKIQQRVVFNAVGIFIAKSVLSVPEGISLIHVPLKVTTVDGVAKTLASVGDLYDALGGADTVSLLITYNSQTERWTSYLGPRHKGQAADRLLTDDLGIIASMKAPVSIGLEGTALGVDGSSAIMLQPGLNLVGVPLKDERITRVSDLLALDGIRDNVSVIIGSHAGAFNLVVQAGDPGDVEITGGQSFIMTARERATVDIEGDAWANAPEPTAASPRALSGIQAEGVTPVLAVSGSIVDAAIGLDKMGLRVTVKNLSTGKMETVGPGADGVGYQLTFVALATGRAAQIGDTLEISAQAANPLIGVQPLRYVVTAEDVKRSHIQLSELVLYEIPAKTELLVNYPNPFNPETWIPYRLAADADVQLTIYNTKGAVVRRLNLGHQPAGFYTTRAKAAYWNGRTENGESVASGIYFYQLRAGDYSATRRMVILK